MKRLFVLLALAVALPLGLHSQAPTPLQPIEPPPKSPDKAAEKPAPKTARDLAEDLTPEEAEKLIASKPGLIILDLRTEEEFDHEHIRGAVNLNYFDPEFATKLAELDQTKPVLVHCGSGQRSVRALREMKVKFPEIYHLTKGIAGWKEAKKPLETKPLPGEGRVGPPKQPKP